jgi:BASS family bile acid:Na+ symporter
MPIRLYWYSKYDPSVVSSATSTTESVRLKIATSREISLKSIVDIGVPILVIFAMLVVGMGLSVADFRRVAYRPGTILLAIVAQSLLLPMIGWLLANGLGLQPTVAVGMLLVAACPSGAMANIYTQLARGDVALSVTLTAVSCLSAGITMPAALAVLQTSDSRVAEFNVPMDTLGVQLLVLLILPVLGGMVIRRRWPDIVDRHGRTLLILSVAALLILLGCVIVQEADQFASAFIEIALAASLLTLMAFGGGWLTSWATGCRRDSRMAVGMVFAVRNVGIATGVAVTVLGRVEFAVFATAYILAQAPILLVGSIVSRPALEVSVQA